MLINITGEGEKRKLIVSQDEEILFQRDKVTLKEAHHLAKTGL